MHNWHTDYDLEGDLYRVNCPYCRESTTRAFLSEALKAGLAHEEKCTARVDAGEA